MKKVISLEVPKTETEIQSEITKYLEKNGFRVYRMNSGRVGGVRLHPTGTPDLLAMRRGISIWIEVKKPGEEPTGDQKRIHKELRADGFKVYVVCSLEELLSYSNRG
jgi:hypothetical protein